MKRILGAISSALGSAGRATLALMAIGGIVAALADNYTATQGAGTTFGSHVVSTVNYPQAMMCDYTAPATQCLAINSSGQIALSNSSFAVTQGTAANLNATVVGTGTFAVQSAPTAISTWGLASAAQNVSTPTNGLLVQGQFNTTPTTVASGNISPLQMDNAGNLLVNIKAGAAGGGAVYGPTASGSSAANPPVLIGGTATGVSNANVVVSAVKLASTAAQATDTSLVTNESPNSTLTTNTTASAAVEGTTSDTPYAGSGNSTLSAALRGIYAAVTSSIPSGTARIGYTSDDPCTQLTKKSAPFSITASTQIITGTASNKTYFCSINIIAGAAQNAALVEGTGSVCATNIYGLAGGTTAATGWNLAANGGLTLGSGNGTVIVGSADSNVLAANVCLIVANAVQTSGTLTYVTAP